MSKKIRLLGIVVVMIAMFTGCRLAQQNGGADVNQNQQGTNPENIAEEGDMLVGIFVTTKVLENQDSSGRVYATLNKNDSTEPFIWKLDFGQEGYVYVYPTFQEEGQESFVMIIADDIFCNLKAANNVTTGNEGTEDIEERRIDAAIYYLSSEIKESVIFYINPVYQTEEGRIYAVNGDSFQGFDTGISFNSTNSSERSQKDGDITLTERFEVSIDINGMDLPTNICILQMDGNHGIISSKNYKPGEVDKELKAMDGAEYILVETTYTLKDGSTEIVREIYEKDDDMIETYYPLENNFISILETQLIW